MIENIEEKPQAGQAMSNGLSVEVNNNLNSLPVSISNSPSTEHSKRQVNRHKSSTKVISVGWSVMIIQESL